MAKAKIATKSIDSTTGVATFTFANGAKLVCDPSVLSQDIVTRLAWHGLMQKVGDSYAGAESVSEAQANAESVWEGLLAGEWSTRARGGILAQALADVTGKDLGDCIKVVDGMDDATKRKLRKDPRIAARIIEIQKASIGEGAEADLDGLFGSSEE